MPLTLALDQSHERAGHLRSVKFREKGLNGADLPQSETSFEQLADLRAEPLIAALRRGLSGRPLKRNRPATSQPAQATDLPRFDQRYDPRGMRRAHDREAGGIGGRVVQNYRVGVRRDLATRHVDHVFLAPVAEVSQDPASLGF